MLAWKLYWINKMLRSSSNCMPWVRYRNLEIKARQVMAISLNETLDHETKSEKINTVERTG